MQLRSLTQLAATALVAVGLTFGAEVPRPAPSLAFQLTPAEKTDLAKYKGKPTVVEFLLTTCGHCQAVSRSLQTLHKEFGDRVQIVGVAINDGASNLVGPFKNENGLTWPVGYLVQREQAYVYLQHSVMSRLLMPQVVFIDKNGTIVDQWSGEDSRLNSVDTLRAALNKIAPPAPAAPAKRPAAKKATR